MLGGEGDRSPPVQAVGRGGKVAVLTYYALLGFPPGTVQWAFLGPIHETPGVRTAGSCRDSPLGHLPSCIYSLLVLWTKTIFSYHNSSFWSLMKSAAFGFYRNFIIPAAHISPSSSLFPLSLTNPVFKRVLTPPLCPRGIWRCTRLLCGGNCRCCPPASPRLVLHVHFRGFFLGSLKGAAPHPCPSHSPHFPMVSPSKGPPWWPAASLSVPTIRTLTHLLSLLGELPALPSARWCQLRGWLPGLIQMSISHPYHSLVRSGWLHVLIK